MTGGQLVIPKRFARPNKYATTKSEITVTNLARFESFIVNGDGRESSLKPRDFALVSSQAQLSLAYLREGAATPDYNNYTSLAAGRGLGTHQQQSRAQSTPHERGIIPLYWMLRDGRGWASLQARPWPNVSQPHVSKFKLQ